MTKKIYLAGPDVFLPNAVEIGQRKKDICAKYGLIGLYPFDNEEDNVIYLDKKCHAYSIYVKNKRMMDECDGAVINLTPFRGASADVGTIFELGYLRGIGKLFTVYSNTNTTYLERIGDKFYDGKKWIDRQGLSIEDFGVFDNLMIWGSATDYPIIRPVDKPWLDWNNLTMFERAVKAFVVEDEMYIKDFPYNKLDNDVEE